MKKTHVIFCLVMTLSLCNSCFDPDDYEDIDTDEIFWFTSENNLQAAADGASPQTVSMQIDSEVTPANRKVVFKTSRGSFVHGSGDSIVVSADNERNVSAQLVSTRPGNATVTAKIGDLNAVGNRQIEFIQALPDFIQVTVDSLAMSNSPQSETVITASLGTNSGGVPSLRHRVDMNVVDSLGNDIGDFLNGIGYGFTNSAGQVKLRFAAVNENYEGLLTIIAATDSNSGRKESKSQIYLVKTN